MASSGERIQDKDKVTATTFWELLEKRAMKTPDMPFLIECENQKGQVTVGETKDMVEKLAAGLYAKGIGPQSVVAWQMPTRLTSVILLFALARLGAVQNPILHLFREREIKDILVQTKPEWFLVPPVESTCDYPAQANAVAAEVGFEVMVLDNDWPQGDPATLPAAPQTDQDMRWLYCTSGTTSGPKAVLHTDSSLIAGGHALGDSLDSRLNDVYSIAYPVAHIGGAISVVMMLEHGIPAVLVERFDPAAIAGAFREHKVTIAGGSTAHYQAWFNFQQQTPDHKVLPDLRVMAGGGASKPPQLYQQSLDLLGVPIVHSYGMTECPMAAMNSPVNSVEHLTYSDGSAATGMEIGVMRSDGSWAEIGEVGEVVLKGKSLCKGYLNEAQNKDVFDEKGYYHTGDLAKIDDAGFVSICGRLKDIIIRKGENISALEIEELLMDYPGVKGVAVIGLPDEARGELVCAVLEKTAQKIQLSDITKFLSEKGLMKIKLPEQLEIVEELPRSQALGKVSKKELRTKFASI